MSNINYPDKSFFFDYSNKMKCVTFPIMTQVINKYSKDGMLSLQISMKSLRFYAMMSLFLNLPILIYQKNCLDY